MEEIVGAWIIYGRSREPKAFFELGERGLMNKHLEKLMRLGKVVQEKSKYINPVVAEITMLNYCKALLRQTRRPYLMITQNFTKCDVPCGVINTFKRCK